VTNSVLGKFKMVALIRRIFGWWYGATIGTLVHTFFKGTKVGEDAQGNAYYQEKNGARRWVIYKTDIEASKIPPEWHMWLHHTVDYTPAEKKPVRKEWEKELEPNMTGTVHAYYPTGSLNEGGKRSTTTGDYEAWTPGA